MTQHINFSRALGETWLMSLDFDGASAVSGVTFRIATREGVTRGDAILGAGVSKRERTLDLKITPGMQQDFSLTPNVYLYEVRATMDDATVVSVAGGTFYVERSPFGFPDPIQAGDGGIMDFYDPAWSGMIVLLEDI